MSFRLLPTSLPSALPLGRDFFGGLSLTPQGHFLTYRPNDSNTPSTSPTLSRNQVTTFATTCLKCWRGAPGTRFDYATFLLAAEHLDDPTLLQHNLLARWQQAAHEVRQCLEKPRDLFEACFPGTARFDSVRKNVADAMRLLWRKHFRTHRDDYPKMSGFLLNGTGNCSARMKFTLAIFDPLLSPRLPEGQRLAIQVFHDHVATVVYDDFNDSVWSLTGEMQTSRITAPLYDPALIFHAYLQQQGISSPCCDDDFLLREGDVKKNQHTQNLDLHHSDLIFPHSEVSYAHERSRLITNIEAAIGRWKLLLIPLQFQHARFKPPSWIGYGSIWYAFGIVLLGTALIQASEWLRDLFSHHDDIGISAMTIEGCKQLHGATSEPSWYALGRHYLGFSYTRATQHPDTRFERYVTRLCFSTSAEADAFNAESSPDAQFDHLLQRASALHEHDDFQRTLTFLSDPLAALDSFSANEFSAAVHFVEALDFMHDQVNRVVFSHIDRSRNYYLWGVWGRNPLRARLSPYDRFRHDLRDEIVLTHEDWATYNTGLASFSTWAQEHPRDALAYVNAAPEGARLQLFRMMGNVPFTQFWLQVKSNTDEQITRTTHEPVPSIAIEIETEFPDRKSPPQTHMDAKISDESRQQNTVPAQPSPLPLEKREVIGIAPATAFALMLRTFRYNLLFGELFVEYQRQGLWNAEVSEYVENLEEREPDFYSVLAHYASNIDAEEMPNHLKTFLEEGMRKGVLVYIHSIRRYVPRTDPLLD